MILHVLSMVSVFIDQLKQAPIVVQCPQAVPESWLKWLLPTIVQIVVSLTSIAAGVCIAVWSFRKNRQSEGEQWVRNQKAGHEAWIRDQKKAEWRELLDAASASQIEIWKLSGLADTPELQTSRLNAEVNLQRIYQLLDDRIFIDESVLSPLRSKWFKVKDDAKKSANSSDVIVKFLPHHSYSSFMKQLRRAAQIDLGFQDEGTAPK